MEDLFADDFKTVVPKIEGVISDNAAAAHLTRVTLIEKLNEKDPGTVRIVVKCSGKFESPDNGP